MARTSTPPKKAAAASKSGKAGAGRARQSAVRGGDARGPRRDTSIPSLGPRTVDSPLRQGRFIDAERVLLDVHTDTCALDYTAESLEEAGPRRKIFFDPAKTKCAVVTCGGLCPGINDVIRSIVLEAHHNYGVAAVMGIRYGLEGFIPRYGHGVMNLNPESVSRIHQFGGTILGSSRGPQNPAEVVDALERLNVGALFIIGGDGSMKAAGAIHAEVMARDLRMSVIGIPKTIDNDIAYVSPSFGFDTAVGQAAEAIDCAHTEAVGAPWGIGLVKLMGRESGFIAAQASLALKEVNFVLVPEDPFELDGPQGLLAALERRLRSRGHAVIVTAEGAGQHLAHSSGKVDASGNPVLGDIAKLLSESIKTYFKDRLDITLKYIDPSYIIRSVPANSNDRIYCGFLGQHAVHAGMAGKTGMVVSRWNGHYVHVPLAMVTGGGRRRIDTSSNFWRSVLESTGQLAYFAPHNASA